MLQLRAYQPSDAEIIVTWIKDEKSLRKWSADRYASFPISAIDINEKYQAYTSDFSKNEKFFPMTSYDESGVVGHLIMRFIDNDKKILRFGYVIVDNQKRGMGYGKEMLKLAILYAFNVLNAQKITLGVFANNLSAYYCYKAVGFQEVVLEEPEYYLINGEKWECWELELIQ